MSNLALAKRESSMPVLAMTEAEQISVLQSSLYPGAMIESIKMVISYCKATGLDPMQKPVHIVPVWDGKKKEMRDVIMPGVGLYRTQASRSGEYAGMSDPDFGEDTTEQFDDESFYDKYKKSNEIRKGFSVTYPKFCKITVKRMLANGLIAEFSAKEFWKENYATQAKDSAQPNSMWRRRPYAQLAKCAEAQALRKAFPEFGSAPTADEMEGKEFEHEVVATQPQAEKEKQPLPPYPQDRFDTSFQRWDSLIQAGKKTPDEIIDSIASSYTLSEEQKSSILELANPPVIEGVVVNENDQ